MGNNRRSNSYEPNYYTNDMIRVDPVHPGLGAGGPYAPRRSRANNFTTGLSYEELRQQAEIDRLSTSLFDRNEIGVRDRWAARKI